MFSQCSARPIEGHHACNVLHTSPPGKTHLRQIATNDYKLFYQNGTWHLNAQSFDMEDQFDMTRTPNCKLLNVQKLSNI